MNAKELRLGNFVFDNENIPMQIAKLETEKYTDWNSGNTVNAILEKDGQYYESDIMNYIPLTEQWLIDFGFKEEIKLGNVISSYNVFKLEDFTYNSNHGWWYMNISLKNQPKYVHQLQNLYFALCGEELTLNK
jgi:hypothetical protein